MRTCSKSYERVSGTILLLLPLLNGSCSVKMNTINIGQKTSLEKQLMGEVEPLTEEEMLVASVRAGRGVPIGSKEDLKTLAIAGRRRQLFNRDDIDELKGAGCLGEGLKAQLVARSCKKSTDAENSKLMERLVAEENQDRQAIIDWALGVDPVLTADDRPQVVGLYHRLLLERSNKGDWIQKEDRSWVRR